STRRITGGPVLLGHPVLFDARLVFEAKWNVVRGCDRRLLFGDALEASDGNRAANGVAVRRDICRGIPDNGSPQTLETLRRTGRDLGHPGSYDDSGASLRDCGICGEIHIIVGVLQVGVWSHYTLPAVGVLAEPVMPGLRLGDGPDAGRNNTRGHRRRR